MKIISDEEFNEAYNNRDNQNIIKKVCSNFNGRLSEDSMREAGLMGLWKCLKGHDSSYGGKFVTSLFRYVMWECKKILKPSNEITNFEGEIPVASGTEQIETREYIDMLPDKQSSIIYQRYYENKTFKEIGESEGCTKESARQNVKKALIKLREFGVY